MKATKKIAAIMLALMLALSMTVTAFAADTTGSITVDNPINGQAYTAYKVFDLVYNTGKTAYDYTIQSDSEWYQTVSTYATPENGLTLTKVNGTNKYNVKITEGTFSAAKFAETLKAKVSGKTGTALTLSDGKATATGLPLGYYFVSSTSGALCNLTTTAPDATIHDKNDMPFDKVDDRESVDVGETVTYTITGKVPDTTGFTSYTYKITDTMSAGLTFQNDVTVTIGGTAVQLSPDYANNGFTLSIPVMNYQTQVGAEIKVSYTATVNDAAVAVVSENKAQLTYSNDPSDSTKTASTPEDKETVYSAKVVIDKYAAGDENKKLAGAQFRMYKKNADGTDLYYKYNSTDKKVEWVAEANADVKTTDTNGAASFNGIADGTYYLEEIKAPDGYNLLTAPKEVTVNGAVNLTATVKVPNATGPMLPSTGGIGTTIIFIIGGALVLGAVVILVTRKRMDKKN